MVAMDDFEVGQYVGHRRPGSIGEGDVIRVVHRRSGETLAMKRIEVEPPEPKLARALLEDLTRSSALKVHSAWINLHADSSFVFEYTDRNNTARTRCCVVEELADRSLEQELISRAYADRPFEDLFRLFAALLHGLQAFHVQGFLHRGICCRNVFFKGSEIKLGTPGPEGQPATASYYPNGECNTYSADIFALGLVFFEMAMLHLLSDLHVDAASAITSLTCTDSSTHAEALCAWAEEQTSILGLRTLASEVLDVLVAMLCQPASARPTADDLLELPVFAPYFDPLQVLPAAARPCIAMAHQPGVAFRDVPRREVLTMPGLHRLYSRRGAALAVRSNRYSWCGKDHELWWLEAEQRPCPDKTNAAALSAEVPAWPSASSGSSLDLGVTLRPSAAQMLVAQGGTAAARALAETALRHRAVGRLLAAEILFRSALLDKACAADAEIWLGLVATLLERGQLSSSRLCFEHARRLSLSTEAADSHGFAPSQVRLFGLGEFFVALESFSGRVSGKSKLVGPSPRESSSGPAGSGASWRSRPGSGNSGVAAPMTEEEAAAAALRAAHAALYYQSMIAVEAGSWQTLAALGEFYTLIGRPEPPLPPSCTVRDTATAVSYFEQARSMAPPGEAPFVEERLKWLELRGET
mmetsp:Transcript_45756/g.82812  ORF Transcript_45756/g.82812 Transcript_45756/m.82812 type:complete len:641 (+) Transcript_45756:34-1956(+)